jgi:adenosine deaminase
MRPSTLAERAEHYGIPVPQVREFGSFTAFAGLYVAACEVLRTWDDLRRVVRECVEDAAAAGAAWVEPALYAPHHRERLGPDEEVLLVALEEGRSAGAELGVGFGLMVASDRTKDPAEAIEIARLAVRLKDQGVVAFGLANDEAPFPPAPFAAAFAVARDGGLLSTPHAGELAGPDSVRDALDFLHADRIQHGVRAVEDPALVKRLADEGICLDVCPTSNLLLSVVPSLEAHPLPELLAAGVRCSLNGDDPLLFGPGLLEEYQLCRDTLGLDDHSLASLARSSLECSGAPRDLVADAVKGVDAWLAA